MSTEEAQTAKITLEQPVDYQRGDKVGGAKCDATVLENKDYTNLTALTHPEIGVCGECKINCSTRRKGEDVN